MRLVRADVELINSDKPHRAGEMRVVYIGRRTKFYVASMSLIDAH